LRDEHTSRLVSPAELADARARRKETIGISRS